MNKLKLGEENRPVDIIKSLLEIEETRVETFPVCDSVIAKFKW